MSQLNLHRGPPSLLKSYRCPGSADRYTHTPSKVIWHKLQESHHFLPRSEQDLQLIPLTGSWTSNKNPQVPGGPSWDSPISPSGPVLCTQIKHANTHRWEGEPEHTSVHVHCVPLGWLGFITREVRIASLLLTEPKEIKLLFENDQREVLFGLWRVEAKIIIIN